MTIREELIEALADSLYPMPERDQYETQTDWVTATVMVRGKRQGWIEAHATRAEPQGETEQQREAMEAQQDDAIVIGVKTWHEGYEAHQRIKRLGPQTEPSDSQLRAASDVRDGAR